MTRRTIPKFKNEDDVAAFWDQHPTTSYLADLKEVTAQILPALRSRVVARVSATRAKDGRATL